jgi:hypothetical protein
VESPYEGKPNIRYYCIIPARAMQDESLTRNHLRVLACIGMYSNSHGVCWPSQVTIGRHLGVNPTWISTAVSALVKKGYLRKLKHKDYPKGIKRRSRGRVNRYQILYKGNDPLPTLEQFWAPSARFGKDSEHDELDDLSNVVGHMQSGVQGEVNRDYQVLAHEFKRAVEAACGLARAPEQSMQAAKLLADQGVTAEQVYAATFDLCREWMARGRTPPANLSQVESLKSLCKS